MKNEARKIDLFSDSRALANLLRSRGVPLEEREEGGAHYIDMPYSLALEAAVSEALTLVGLLSSQQLLTELFRRGQGLEKIPAVQDMILSARNEAREKVFEESRAYLAYREKHLQDMTVLELQDWLKELTASRPSLP